MKMCKSSLPHLFGCVLQKMGLVRDSLGRVTFLYNLASIYHTDSIQIPKAVKMT